MSQKGNPDVRLTCVGMGWDILLVLVSPPLKSLLKGPPPSFRSITATLVSRVIPKSKLPHRHVCTDEFTQTGAKMKKTFGKVITATMMKISSTICMLLSRPEVRQRCGTSCVGGLSSFSQIVSVLCLSLSEGKPNLLLISQSMHYS